jgi:hypothetical protein
MKVSKIAHLTIYRPESRSEYSDLILGWDSNIKAIVWDPGPDISDEEILADIECTKLIDDESAADYAATANVAIIAPPGEPLVAEEHLLHNPPDQCVINRMRSIRARQSAIASGLVPKYTPLVG